jgi:hypothetical protein
MELGEHVPGFGSSSAIGPVSDLTDPTGFEASTRTPTTGATAQRQVGRVLATTGGAG